MEPPEDKTPVGVLQESCSKRGISPLFELTSEAPIFEYRVMVDDLAATGRGRKKKSAKQVAAKALLILAIEKGRHLQWHIPGGESVEAARKYVNGLLNLTEDAESLEKQPQMENTIAVLIEHCRKRRLPLPVFDENPVGEGVFGCNAIVGNLSKFASGRSKKAAKRSAAQALLHTLKHSAELEGMEDEDLPESGSAYPKDLEKQLSALKNETEEDHRTESAGFQDWMELDLQKEPEEGFVNILAGISKRENGYEPSYYPMSYRSKLGLYQCLVQLPTTPVAVSFGEGKHKNEAKWAAAQNALKYLKVMDKKGNVELNRT